MLDDRLMTMETIVSSNSVMAEQAEKQIKSVLDFFPIEDLKFSDTINGEDYISKIARTTYKKIQQEALEDGEGTGNAQEEFEKLMNNKLQDLQRQIIKIRVQNDMIPDIKREVSNCIINLDDKAPMNEIERL